MDNYSKYNHKKSKIKNYYSDKANKKKIYPFYNNNILQFSINAINNILLNNLNSSITLGIINIINNIPINNKQIANNNIYLNSINDCVDYKIKGNIYKTPKEELIYLYPNIDNIIRNKSLKQKKELKILKFDKEILSSQVKTPTKKISKNFYFNLMKNNNINININNNEDYNENYTHFTHSQNNSDNIPNDNYAKNDFIYKVNKTNNSNITNNIQYNNNINNNNNNIKINTYIKKKSPNKKYIISKTNLNTKENSIEKKNINMNMNMNNNHKNNLNKKHPYKTLDKQPKKLIIYTKNKDKSKIINSLKSKNTINYKQTKLNLDLNNISSNCNNNYYTQNNKKESPKTARNININYNQNKKILSLNKNRNKLLLTPNKNITKIKTNNINNKNLNIQYNPTISNNISINTPGGVIFNNKKVDKKNIMNYHTIDNNKNYIDNKNKNVYKKVQTDNNENINNLYKTKTFEDNNIKKKNTIFDNDENSIFKILDNTQIISPEDCGSSTNSNNLYQFSGSGRNSNGTNTNQDTDYNSIKTFNNCLMKENKYNLENEHKNILQNKGNLRFEDNFSFNNL